MCVSCWLDQSLYHQGIIQMLSSPNQWGLYRCRCRCITKIQLFSSGWIKKRHLRDPWRYVVFCLETPCPQKDFLVKCWGFVATEHFVHLLSLKIQETKHYIMLRAGDERQVKPCLGTVVFQRWLSLVPPCHFHLTPSHWRICPLHLQR